MSHRLHTRPGARPGAYLLRLFVVATLSLLAAALGLTLVLVLRQPDPGQALGWVVQAFWTACLLVALPWLWRWALDARPRAAAPVLAEAEDVGPSQHPSFAGPDEPDPPRRW